MTWLLGLLLMLRLHRIEEAIDRNTAALKDEDYDAPEEKE